MKRISADAEPVKADTVADVKALLKEATATVNEIHLARCEIRDTVPRPKLAETLAETDESYPQALRDQALLQKRLGRLQNGKRGNAQTVKVGTVRGNEKVGK